MRLLSCIRNWWKRRQYVRMTKDERMAIWRKVSSERKQRNRR